MKFKDLLTNDNIAYIIVSADANVNASRIRKLEILEIGF